MSRILQDNITIDLNDVYNLRDSVHGGVGRIGLALKTQSKFLPASFPPIFKTVHYVLDGRQFVMRLEISKTPEVNYYFRDPTPGLIELLRRGGKTFVDVGGNVGLYSLIGSLFFEAVYAFEPDSDNIGKLKKNIGLSNIHNIQVVSLGLSHVNGIGRFVKYPQNPGMHTMSNEAVDSAAPENIVEIDTVTLDTYFSDKKIDTIDLIKLDTEGTEFEIVMGGREVIFKHRPILFSEFHSNEKLRKFVKFIPDDYDIFSPKTRRQIKLEDLLRQRKFSGDLVFWNKNPF
jgi:FkbM family methyltransferase